MESAVWGLIGTVVGAGASLITTYLTNRHSSRLSSEARAEERLEKFREFQRETLLELQAALNEVARTTFLVHLEDSKALVSGVEWGKGRIPDQLAEEDMIARRRVSIYVSRAADESVRNAVKQMMSAVSSMIKATSRTEADRALADVAAEGVKAIELVGKVLRDTY